MRASYRNGIRWIAGNDEPSCVSVDTVSEMISVCLLADLFGKDPVSVAKDVVKARIDAVKARIKARENAPCVCGAPKPHTMTEDCIPF